MYANVVQYIQQGRGERRFAPFPCCKKAKKRCDFMKIEKLRNKKKEVRLIITKEEREILMTLADKGSCGKIREKYPKKLHKHINRLDDMAKKIRNVTRFGVSTNEVDVIVNTKEVASMATFLLYEYDNVCSQIIKCKDELYAAEQETKRYKCVAEIQEDRMCEEINKPKRKKSDLDPRIIT